ncbi:MAG: VCBS repeat-containing protein, partial [Acidobacteriota bacterium]|nr:VCBS repeat-containing protein [Acidobacteriota bacterium]
MKFTRREWVGLLAAAGAPTLLGYQGAPSSESKPLFEEIPPSSSGIEWVHDNAMSPARYLPETLGPGCAFLDFDNDGWMDIYLVNSGPSDFWKASKSIRNALYKNNRDGTFIDVTEKAGVSGGTFGMGVA